MRRLWIVVAGLGLVIVVLSVIVLLGPMFTNSSMCRLNARVDSIDIEAGRYRYQRYILGVRLIDRVEETPFSRMYRQLIGPPPAPEWRIDSWFSPSWRHHSRGFPFRGTLGSAYGLAASLESGMYSQDAKKAGLDTFLYLLHDPSRGHKPKMFASDLGCVEAYLADSGKVILDASDLPQLYDIRMEVRTGEEPTFTLVAVADLPQMTGRPLRGVEIALEPKWERTWDSPYLTGTDGSMRTPFAVPRLDPWELEEGKKLAMGFSCAKEGYVTVEGEFSLEDFRGKVQAHGRALFVRMRPRDRWARFSRKLMVK